MKKRVYIYMMLCCCILLCSCTKSSDTSAGKQQKTSDSVTVVWALPEGSEVPEKNVRKFNQLLAKKGYGIAVDFVYLPSDTQYQDPSVYHDALAEQMKEGKVDIAYCDMEYDDAPGEMRDYLSSGLFCSLGEWLASEEGRKVYSLYDEDVWKGCAVDGVNYILPNEIYYDAPVQIVGFQKDHVSEEWVSRWDGSWKMLWSMLQKLTVPKGDRMILGYPELESFEGAVDQMTYHVEDGIVYNIQTGEVYQPFALEEFHEYLYFLHQCYQAGYLSEDAGINSVFVDQESIDLCEQGAYVMTFQPAQNLADVYCKETSFAVSGVLGEGTAVSAYSRKQREAFSLLAALRTEDELANTLVWGNGDSGQMLDEDGYATESVDVCAPKSALGLSDGLFQSEEEEPVSLDLRQYRQDAMQSPLRTSSCMTGFWPDYDGIDKELAKYRKALGNYADCWQDKDFESAYRKADKKLDAASADVLKEIRKQIKNWKKS